MKNAIETIKYRGHDINIYPEDYPENPRIHYDCLGTMICWHNRYNLGDKHDWSDSNDLLSNLSGIEEGQISDGSTELINKLERAVVILPLYLYDHSGVAMSVRPFSCPWDSGQVGYIYITRERIKAEYPDGIPDEKIITYLTGEVETYSQYLNGDIYYYDVEDIGNCGGFYGHDFEDNGMLAEARGEIDYHVTQQYKAHFKKLKEWIKNGVPAIYRQPSPTI